MYDFPWRNYRKYEHLYVAFKEKGPMSPADAVHYIWQKTAVRFKLESVYVMLNRLKAAGFMVNPSRGIWCTYTDAGYALEERYIAAEKAKVSDLKAKRVKARRAKQRQVAEFTRLLM